MASFIEQLPAELTENIVHFLTVEDVGSLRLASSALRHKTSQNLYCDRFRKRNVDLTSDDLALLSSVIKPGSIACVLQDLTVTGLAYDPEPEAVGSDIYRSWPRSQAFISHRRQSSSSQASKDRQSEIERAEYLLAKAKYALEVARASHLESLVAVFRQLKHCIPRGRLAALRRNVAVVKDTNRRYHAHESDHRLA